MSEMKCRRCGANESRIHGFCSIACEDKFYFEEEIAELTDRIAELEAAQRWIPVSERMPEVNTDVLVAFMDKNPNYCSSGVAWFCSSTNNWEIEVDHYGPVTHWMPIPKLPEVQE